MQKPERLFRLAQSSKRALHWQSYKKYHNFVQRHIHLAHSNYVNEVIGGSREVTDAKAFWNYIKLQPTESIGILPLQVGVDVFDSNEGKADILNKHFQSAFTLEDTSSLPQLPPSPYPQTDHVITNTPGLEKKLQKLKPNKAAGPDQISPWVLKTFAPQCAQILQVIFTQSYEVASYMRSGKKHLFLLCIRRMINNYRPIPLTCILCKIMEHVLCSHLSNHIEINNILTPHQHGFWKGFCTETHPISILDNWFSSLDKRISADVL